MDQIFSMQLLIAALVLSSIYVLVALGLNLVYGTMRLLNVAHGELMMIGGYVAYWAFALTGTGALVSMFAAVALTAGLGGAFYLAVFRPLSRRAALAARLEQNSMIIFFGVSIVIQNLMSLAFAADPRSYDYLDTLIDLGGGRVELNRLVILGVGTAVTLACVGFFRFHRLGLAARALIQNRDAAALIGIDADRINLMVFCLGFGLAGLAGALVSMTEEITPFGGFPYTIAAFIVIILGGLGNLAGGILGGILLAFIEIYGAALTSSAYRSILIYGVFIAILSLRPQGLMGRRLA
ncbi:branched-chain amino acid ABC transporter permease [Oceanicella sp. SM1341]|uniref:branched-chain amino acid ABC transporter permease n=1 Tax=Oceanicella sp. SM1341 TaxID=1548889 RepID=UPI000E4CC5DC|nr:branched-chain amino acid ABC transporter permease [Oceanicella sp. SM1341]